MSALQSQLRSQGGRLAVDGALGPQTDRSVRDLQAGHHLTVERISGSQTWNDVVGGFERLARPEVAAQHLMDAWAADDRRTALRSATQAAVDLLLRGRHGGPTPAGYTPDPVLGPGHGGVRRGLSHAPSAPGHGQPSTAPSAPIRRSTSSSSL